MLISHGSSGCRLLASPVPLPSASPQGLRASLQIKTQEFRDLVVCPTLRVQTQGPGHRYPNRSVWSFELPKVVCVCVSICSLRCCGLERIPSGGQRLYSVERELSWQAKSQGFHPQHPISQGSTQGRANQSVWSFKLRKGGSIMAHPMILALGRRVTFT